jgi:L-ascorbate metabolism protein UlaG (beta-lactamase superfamily)
MELTYIGHSCFHIKGKKLSLVIDPYNPDLTGFKMPKQNCKLLLNTHNHEDHSFNQQVNHEVLINTPGEYEIDDVYITGIQTAHDDKDGAERGQNIVFSIDIDGISIVHLGDLGHELNEKVVAKLGSIDILLIPVGGEFTIDSFKASKIISALEPKIVIPMHFKSEDSKLKELSDVNAFLHEMGEKNPEKMDSLKIQSAPSNDDLKIILLNSNH